MNMPTWMKPANKNGQCQFDNATKTELFDQSQTDAYTVPTGACPLAEYPDCQHCGKCFVEVDGESK